MVRSKGLPGRIRRHDAVSHPGPLEVVHSLDQLTKPAGTSEGGDDLQPFPRRCGQAVGGEHRPSGGHLEGSG